MASSVTIEQIHGWVQEWFPGENWTMDDVKMICRGPMKDVLLNFLMPKFKTDEQIDYIRSNLYAHSSLFSGSKKEPLSFSPTEKACKQKMETLEKLEEQKETLLNAIASEEEDVLKKMNYYSKGYTLRRELKWKKEYLSLLRNLSSTTSKLMLQLKPLIISEDKVYVERTEDLNCMENLYEETCDLFSSLFFKTADPSETYLKELDSKLKEMVRLMASGDSKIKHVEVWYRNEWEKYYATVSKGVEDKENLRQDGAQSKYEELLINEIDNLKDHLIDYHVNLNQKNQNSLQEWRTICGKRHTEEVELLNSGNPDGQQNFEPSEFKLALRREELQHRLAAVRNIRSKQLYSLPVIYADPTLPIDESLLQFEKTKMSFNDLKGDHSRIQSLNSSFIKSYDESKSKLFQAKSNNFKIANHEFLQTCTTLLDETSKNQVQAINARVPNGFGFLEDPGDDILLSDESGSGNGYPSKHITDTNTSPKRREDKKQKGDPVTDLDLQFQKLVETCGRILKEATDRGVENPDLAKLLQKCRLETKNPS